MLLATMILSTMLLAPLVLAAVLAAVLPRKSSIRRRLRRRRHLVHSAALQVDIHSTLVFLGRILQPHLATHLFYPRLDLLHVVSGVISFSNNNVKMCLALAPSCPDPFLQHIFGLFYEQTVQINGVACDAPFGIVFAEYEVARLPVVLVHVRRMLLALFAKLVSARAIAGLVGFMGSVEARGSFRGFLAGEVAQAVVFLFGVGGRVV